MRMKSSMPKLMTCSITLGLVSSLLTVMPASAQSNEAVALLNKMTSSLRHLDYKGKLVFIKNKQVTTLSIEYSNNGEFRKEIIQPLDKNGKAITRQLSGFTLSKMPKIDPAMEKIYSFDMGSMSKVAGQPCRTVIARPKDRKRYLKKFCIDENSGFLYQYTLSNQKHEVVEQFMFTDVVVQQPVPVDQIPDTAKQSDVQVIATTAPEVALEPNPLASKESQPDQYSKWLFDPLPKGFKVVKAEQNISQAEQQEGMIELEEEKILLSDGLSSISVFIATPEEKNRQPHPVVQSGALNILSKQKQGRMITLVGEVPKDTLIDIFKCIKKANLE